MPEEIVYVDEQNNPTSPPNQTAGATPTGTPSYAPTQGLIKNDKADILEKIDPTKIVKMIEHRLMGEEFDNEKKVWTRLTDKEGKPLVRALSKAGASDIASLMLPASSQNVSITRLKDTTIRMRALSITKQALKMCLKNWKEYGITGRDQLGFVKEIVFTNTLITLKQAEGGWVGNLIKGVTSESIVHSTQPEKRGLFFRRR